MTIHDEAQEYFDDLGLDRTDIRTVAKSIAQQIIDDDGPGPALRGLVYEVRTLYDEGVPQCGFRAGDDETVCFRGQFHAEGTDEPVTRERTMGAEALQAHLEQLTTPKAPESRA